MPRKPRTPKTALPTASEPQLPDGLVNEEPVNYPLATTRIVAQQVYSNPDRHPDEPGPWSNEADKVAWVDEETGLGCIMLRQVDGTLSGYVGVGPDHPLFGFEVDAVPLDISATVHGGLTYGKACEVNRVESHARSQTVKERYSVCHVTRTRTRTIEYHVDVQTTEDEFHEDLWWLGFDTNHDGDARPNDDDYERRSGDVYRDQSFVYGQCIDLARCLRRIASESGSPDEMAGSPVLLPSRDTEGESN